MVYIPEEGRSTLCISSQVGCAMDCSFCATAQQGFNSNLSTAEIVGQVLLAQTELGFKAGDDRIISNVVLMGMGEPLANFRNVVPAMRILLDELGLDFSRRRLTLSTSGLVPQIYKLAEESNVALAVSLHAPGRRTAQPAGAHQPPAQHRRAARGLLGIHRRGQRPQRHLRIRDARRRERFARAGARTGAAAEGASGQGEPDSLQSIPGHAVQAFQPGGDQDLPRPGAQGRSDGNDPQDPWG